MDQVADHAAEASVYERIHLNLMNLGNKWGRCTKWGDFAYSLFPNLTKSTSQHQRLISFIQMLVAEEIEQISTPCTSGRDPFKETMRILTIHLHHLASPVQAQEFAVLRVLESVFNSP